MGLTPGFGIFFSWAFRLIIMELDRRDYFPPLQILLIGIPNKMNIQRLVQSNFFFTLQLKYIQRSFHAIKFLFSLMDLVEDFIASFVKRLNTIEQEEMYEGLYGCYLAEFPNFKSSFMAVHIHRFDSYRHAYIHQYVRMHVRPSSVCTQSYVHTYIHSHIHTILHAFH